MLSNLRMKKTTKKLQLSKEILARHLLLARGGSNGEDTLSNCPNPPEPASQDCTSGGEIRKVHLG
jgi:hypothetical protein